jgi:drug/metabolite transporter (DMT)-like permease
MHPNWFLVALIPPILWSVVNHIDKYVLSKHFKGGSLGGMFLFSSLFSIVVLPCLLFFTPISFLNIPLGTIFFLLLLGTINAAAFFLYLKAINEEEASVVVPLLQMIPVFGYFLGYPILGEVLSSQQILSALIIILGVSILSVNFDIDNNRLTLRKRVLLLVGGSSFLFALHDVLFKTVTTEKSFLISAFWENAGLVVAGITVFIFHSKYRKQFKEIFRINNTKALSLNITSEVLYTLGSLANSFATLLAPVAVVLVVSSYQPLFVFIIGIVLTTLIPSIVTFKCWVITIVLFLYIKMTVLAVSV